MHFFHRLINCIVLGGKFIHVSLQVVWGAWRITRLQAPIVTIFGGSRIDQANHYFMQAHLIAQKLVERNISVVTGAGGGIMEAANCGAIGKENNTSRSIGIGVENLDEGRNSCVSEYFELHYFFARKWLLMNYSRAFIFLPGGFGTLDELFEIVTLMQTKQIEQLPILLVGVEYWQGVVEWLTKTVLISGAISSTDLNIIVLTDDLDLVVKIIINQPDLRAIQ